MVVQVCVSMRVSVCTCACVCVYVHVCVCVCVYICVPRACLCVVKLRRGSQWSAIAMIMPALDSAGVHISGGHCLPL